jgi:WD40 repeat protein
MWAEKLSLQKAIRYFGNPARRQREERKYRVFISYSHSTPGDGSADSEIASWLQRKLENYTFPRRLIGLQTAMGIVPRRIGHVFRDEDYLPAGPELDQLIETALTRSDNLVALCSPRATASPWVLREITRFKQLQALDARTGKSQRHVFALILDGQPDSMDPKLECYPAALKREIDESGRLGDATSYPLGPHIKRDGRENACLRLIAGLFGLDFEDLIAREEQRKKELRRRSLTILAIGLVLTVLATVGILGAGLFAWRNALARADLLASAAKQALLNNRTDQGLLLALFASPGPNGGLLPLVPDAHRALATATLATEQLKRVFPDHQQEISVAEPFPNDGRILAASMDGSVTIFDANDDRIAVPLRTHGAPVELGGIAPDEMHVAIASVGEGILVWRTEATSDPINLPLPPGELKALRFSRDGKLMVIGSDQRVDVWDAQRWVSIKSLEFGVTNLALSPNSATLAISQPDGMIRTFDLRTLKPLWHAKAHDKYVLNLAFSPDGTRVLTGSVDGTAKLLKSENGQISATMGVTEPVLTASFSPDGGSVALTTTSGAVYLFDGHSGIEYLFVPTNAGWTAAAAFSPDGKTLAVGSRNTFIYVIETTTGEVRLVLKGHQKEILKLSFANQNTLVSGGADGSLRLWQIEDRRRRCGFRLKNSSNRKILLAEAVKLAAIQNEDGSFEIVHSSDCQVVSATPSNQSASLAAITPDGKYLVAGTQEGIHIFRTQDGVLSGVLPAFNPSALAASQDYIAIGTKDRVDLWSHISSPPRLRNTIQLLKEVTSIVISPDEKRVAIGLADGSLAVANTASGEVLALYHTDEGPAELLRWSADYKYILAGRSNGTVSVFAQRNNSITKLYSIVSILDAQFLESSELLLLSFDSTLQVLDIETGTELYGYAALPKTDLRAVLSTHGTIASLGSSGSTVIFRNALPTQLRLVQYACSVRPLGRQQLSRDQILSALITNTTDLSVCTQRSTLRELGALLDLLAGR